MSVKMTSCFWIDDFMVDPSASKIVRSSDEVSLEPKVMQVLLLLAEQPSETVLRETFMDRVWAVEFGSDESLTRAVSILRKIFRDKSQRRPIIETIPRKGYRLVGKVSSEAPRSQEEQTDDLVPPQNLSLASKLWRLKIVWFSAVIGTLAIFAVASALTFNRAGESVPVTSNLIRIGTFSSLDGSDRSSALTASVEAQLTSTLTASGLPATFHDSGNEGSPEFTLFGDVLIDNETPSAIINLKHASTGFIVWSSTMTSSRDRDRGFASDVANHVSSVLMCLRSWRTADYQNTPDSLQLYARFCDAYVTQQSVDLSVFTEPILLAEPDNPIAMALHAKALRYRSAKMGGLPGSDDDATSQQSFDLADQALQLDPTSLTVQGLWALTYQHDADPVDIYGKLSTAAAAAGLPTMIYRGYGELLRQAGHAQDSMVIFRRLVSVDPTDATSASRLAWLYAAEGNNRQSERYFEIAESINPELPELIGRRRQVSLWFGDGDAHRALLAEWPVSQTTDTTRSEICQQTYIRQRIAEALDKAQLFDACATYNRIWVARMLVGLGDVDGAYLLLANYDWSRHPSYRINLFYPDMAPFRADPRFWALIEDIGLVSEWTETRRWPDFCRDERHPGYCPTRS